MIEHVEEEFKSELDIKDEFVESEFASEVQMQKIKIEKPIKNGPDVVIDLIDVGDNDIPELSPSKDNVKIVEDHLKQPQIEAVLSGEPAEILHEMEDNDDENEDLECVMETDDTIIPELEIIEFESNSLRSYKSEDVCGG